jgi:hypothetical protein
MKTLGNVTPTSEQLTVIDNSSPDFWLIRGAAGSGKTTTALLRLKFLVRYWRERRADLGLEAPVRVLVLTFNRTLRGYIAELAEQQISTVSRLTLRFRPSASGHSNYSARSCSKRTTKPCTRALCREPIPLD